MQNRFRGLVAAPFTPFNADRSINLDVIPTYARFLRENGVSAAFVCGTTGEGLSLTLEERLAVSAKTPANHRAVGFKRYAMIVASRHRNHASQTGGNSRAPVIVATPCNDGAIRLERKAVSVTRRNRNNADQTCGYASLPRAIQTPANDGRIRS
eukprot:gene37601-60934_t